MRYRWIFCASLASALIASVAGAQVLSSDKEDYAPGETAVLTGSGFQPLEDILLLVTHAEAVPDTGADHEAWMVQADEQGGFVTTWHVCEDDCMGELLRATADGQFSGLHAETFFTDGPFTYSPGNVSLSVPAGGSVSFVQVVTTSGVSGNFTASPVLTGQGGGNHVSSGWVTWSPNPLSFNGSESKSWTITITVPCNVSTGNYSDLFKADASIGGVGQGSGSSLTLTVTPALVPTANAGSDQSACADGTTASFDLVGSASNGSPTWSVVSGSATIANPNALSSQVSVDGTATLRLTVAGCTTATDEVTLTVNSNPDLTETHQSATCFGSSTGSIDLSVSGGLAPYSFSWSNGATSENLTALATGTYSVVVTDAKGCSAGLSVEISEPEQLEASASATDALCFGGDGSVALTVSGGTAPYSFSWSNGATSEDLSAVPAGTYSVTVTDAHGCTATAEAEVQEPDQLVASASATDALCFGGDGSVELTVSGGTAPYSFVWSNGATSEDLSAVPAGTYSVTVTDAHGCTATAEAEVQEPPQMIASASAIDAQCFGGDGSVELTVSGGTAPYSFSWSNGATSEDLSAVPAGTYSVTVTDAHGCTATAEAEVQEPEQLVASASATDALCFGGDGSVALTVSGGTAPYSFVWSNGATSEDLSAVPAGTYSVTVTDAHGCTATAQGAEVSQPSELQASVNSAEICPGSSALLSATIIGGTPPYSCTWSPGGLNSPSISVSTAGIYTVEVTDAHGCSVLSSGTLVVNALATATITGPPSGFVVAVNTPVQFTGTFSGNDGTHTFTWKFDNLSVSGSLTGSSGAVDATYTFTSAGVYMVTLTVTDECGDAVASQVGGVEAMVVVYDPSVGFVTGGGWINSPAGAFALNPALVGKAHFGFVSKYQKGAKIPTGETEFQFSVANLNFHSTAYQWLVISGPNAQYKGTGTINGQPGFDFLLSARDGQVTGDGGMDRFRIKISNHNNGSIVYDNQMGASDDDVATTAIAGGSIVIHQTSSSGRGGSSTASGGESAVSNHPQEYGLRQNAPNPFHGSTVIRFDLPEPSRVTLAVYDLSGREVMTLLEGDLESGTRTVQWSGDTRMGGSASPGIYFVRMTASSSTSERTFSLLRKMVLTR